MVEMKMSGLTVQPFNDSTTPACERCGSFDVLEFAGKFLCADCVMLAGCGCAGHGDDEG
jgi:hypothetical protein